MVAKLGENSEFSQVDINDANMLETSLRGLFLLISVKIGCLCFNFDVNLENRIYILAISYKFGI